jgi:hypothetical protein
VSNIERNKATPIRPDKIFGLIFFQRNYDEVIFSATQNAESDFKIKKTKQIAENCKKFKEAYDQFRDQVKKAGTDASSIKAKWPGLELEHLKMGEKHLNAWNKIFKTVDEEKYD